MFFKLKYAAKGLELSMYGIVVIGSWIELLGGDRAHVFQLLSIAGNTLCTTQQVLAKWGA